VIPGGRCQTLSPIPAAEKTRVVEKEISTLRCRERIE
jgi:hypothetical protein